MRIFANKKFKRFIIILMAVILTVNVIAPAPLVPEAEAASVGGILMFPLTALAGGIAWAFQQVLNGVNFIATTLTSGAMPDTSRATDVFISDIVYNQLEIINANIFDQNNENPLLISPTNENGGITGIVKQWYAITRMMAIAASLVILVYVAIKIILSSTGKDKAKYTELLKDWLLSLLLIFTLHYVMAAILFCSDAIVGFFLSIVDAGDPENVFNYKEIQDATFAFNDYSIIYALVWIAFLIYTFLFLVLYIKRLILICFFVVISPLIVILSTINKLRGKGSGVLEYWLKQFVANVVMQPIDALLFTIVGSSIVICINSNQPLIALAFVIAFYPLRSWITQFFDQKADQNTQEGAKAALGKIAGGAQTVGRVGANLTSNVSGRLNGAKNRGGASGSAGVTGYSGGGPNGGANIGTQGGNNLAQLRGNVQANKNGAMHSGADSTNGVATSAATSYNAQIGKNANGTQTALGSGSSQAAQGALEDKAKKGKLARLKDWGGRNAPVIGRIAKKGAAMTVGATATGFITAANLAAGKGLGDVGETYANFSNATSSMADIGYDVTKPVVGAAYQGVKSAHGYVKEHGIKGTAQNVLNAGIDAKNSVREYVKEQGGVAQTVKHGIASGASQAYHAVGDMILESQVGDPKGYAQKQSEKEYWKNAEIKKQAIRLISDTGLTPKLESYMKVMDTEAAIQKAAYEATDMFVSAEEHKINASIFGKVEANHVAFEQAIKENNQIQKEAQKARREAEREARKRSNSQGKT